MDQITGKLRGPKEKFLEVKALVSPENTIFSFIITANKTIPKIRLAHFIVSIAIDFQRRLISLVVILLFRDLKEQLHNQI